MKTKLVVAGITALAFAAGGVFAHTIGEAFAQGMHHSHGQPSSSAAASQPKGDKGASSRAFASANAKMHKAMDITYTGNADRDFVQGMIAHHQGAVEMAKVVLQFGKDPEVRKLAEGIIKAQEDEISWMKSWLQKNAGK